MKSFVRSLKRCGSITRLFRCNPGYDCLRCEYPDCILEKTRARRVYPEESEMFKASGLTQEHLKLKKKNRRHVNTDGDSESNKKGLEKHCK